MNMETAGLIVSCLLSTLVKHIQRSTQSAGFYRLLGPVGYPAHTMDQQTRIVRHNNTWLSNQLAQHKTLRIRLFFFFFFLLSGGLRCVVDSRA